MHAAGISIHMVPVWQASSAQQRGSARQRTTAPYLEGEQLAHEELVGNDGERKYVNLRAAVRQCESTS